MVLEHVSDSSLPLFALPPDIDVEALAAAYAAGRRIRIEAFLADDGAGRLRDHLSDRPDWRLALKGESNKVFEFDQAARAAMSPEQSRALEKLAAPDRPGFRYLYERLWGVEPEGAREGETSLAGFADFPRSEPVLDLLRRVTGA